MSPRPSSIPSVHLTLLQAILLVTAAALVATLFALRVWYLRDRHRRECAKTVRRIKEGEL